MASSIVNTAGDISGHTGKVVQVQGTYTVQNLGGHALKIQQPDGGWKKVHQIALIKLSDGTFVELAERPDEELTRLGGKRVVATGKLIAAIEPPSEPVMARPDALPRLAEISAITAAG